MCWQPLAVIPKTVEPIHNKTTWSSRVQDHRCWNYLLLVQLKPDLHTTNLTTFCVETKSFKNALKIIQHTEQIRHCRCPQVPDWVLQTKHFIIPTSTQWIITKVSRWNPVKYLLRPRKPAFLKIVAISL